MPDAKKNRGADRRKADPTEEAERQRRHRESRGEKMVPLSDLANELPGDDDLTKYTEYLIEESDRGAAVMATALVEKALEDAIRARLADPGDGMQDTWFKGINAPFRTFASKISLGRALGIYGEETEARLTIIKKIRNAFAHRMIPLDFSHPTLVAACLELSPYPEKNQFGARVLFGTSCLLTAHLLGGDAMEKNRREIEVTFP